MKKTVIKMSLKKSTKGTHVYEAPEDFIPTVYIKREAFGEAGARPPTWITVTIEDDGE
jgi:hypothetical protein